ncbi:MAG: integrase core domain-containing protein [Candidatus Acidiferrum sp.]|jgi:putative transposase
MATNLDITPGPTKNREVPHCTLDRMNKKYSKFSYNPAHWTPKAVVECRCRESMSENWLLDGYSRLLVHWDLRESMTEADIETILERAKERYPGVRPRVISDNGPQFIAKGFKEFIRISGMTHVRTSPYYPQSNSKIERWHKSLKGECIRPGTPLSLEDARRLVKGYVEHYNNVRLNSAIGYITPRDMLAGHQQDIQAERDRKLEAAREQRKNRRQRAA